MKKKWIFIACAIIILFLAVARGSYIVARAALQSGIVQQSVPDFAPSNAFLSREIITSDLCWTFTQISWHDARTVHVSLFGKPMSFETTKLIETEHPPAP
jgi:hypothetical protein